LPNRLNRINYMTAELVKMELEAKQQLVVWTPWSAETRLAALSFQADRRAISQSGSFFCQMAWFDDNSCGALSFFTQTVKSTQRALWRRFCIAFSEAKAAINLYDARSFEPALGLELRCKARQTRLPPSKVQDYAAGIGEMLSDAEQHPQRLVERPKVEKSVGRVLFASGPVPTVWHDFLILIGLLLVQSSFEHYVRFNDRMVACWSSIRTKLQTQNGRPTTSYAYRPGCDGLPVWITRTDASRRTSTFFGAAGGWFHAWESDVVFFFCTRWPEDIVKATNIGELELAAAEIAARLVTDVQVALGCPTAGYLYQYGDNSACFDSVLNGMHARKDGMRFLTARRASQEMALERLLASAFIPREANRPADALANMDVPAFVRLIRAEHPTAGLCRLAVPAAYADLRSLVDWKGACVA
jgi:hypothetical protein